MLDGQGVPPRTQAESLGFPPDRRIAAGAPAAATLRLATATVGYRAVLDVAGAVDDGTVDELGRALDALVASGMHEVWVDLSQVTFIARSGLAALAEVAAELDRRGRRLALIAPAGPALRTLQVADVDGGFRLFADRASPHRGS